MHGAHHDYPNDLKRVVVPPIVSLGGAAFFYMLAYFIFGRYYASPFIVSLFSFYIIYDWFHYASHHVNLKNKYYNHIKKSHLFHHYKDPTKGYGFITTFWDIIFCFSLIALFYKLRVKKTFRFTRRGDGLGS